MLRALTIAGSDSGGGAGIQADLKAFAAVGVHGTSAITCVTAQNTTGVTRVDALPIEAVEGQIDAVLSDLPPGAVKTGMLNTPEVVELVASKVAPLDTPLVVDPVMVATSGDALAASGFADALPALFEHTTLVTPNVDELELLTDRTVVTLDEAERAARDLLDQGPDAVLAKGGHLDGDHAVDLLVTADGTRSFPMPRSDGPFHGAGCHYASTIAGLLARGRSTETAVAEARARVHHAIVNAYRPGRGPQVLDVLAAAPDTAPETPEATAVAVAAWRLAAVATLDIVPEVGINIAYLPPGSNDPNDASGLTRRITRGADGPTAPGPARAGASGHVARVAAAAAKADAGIRAAMNVRYVDGVVDAIEAAGLVHASFRRADEPAGVSSVEWGTMHAIDELGSVPDAVWDEGGAGKEAMVRILGRSPDDVVDKALRLAAVLSGPDHTVE